MAQTFVNLRDNIEQQLQDTGNAVYAEAELAEYMDDALREITDYVPYILPVSYNLESRKGTATSTTTGALIDASEAHFVSGDVGKFVFNTTDLTWSKITAYVSASRVNLLNDIFVSGEGYKIFHSGCRSELELNLVDVLDYHTEVEKVEYPIGYNPPRWRNFEMLNGNILRVKFNGIVGDSGNTGDEVETMVYIRKRHVVSQLTDLAGAVNGAHSAAATSVAINGLQTSGTIETDQEFTIANRRNIYTVTADATIATNAATVNIYPPLESALVGSEVVTFKQSTLTPRLEVVFCELVAGRAAINKAHKLQLQANTAIATLSTGATAVGLSTARTAQAVTYLAAGDDYLTTINIGEPVGGYAQYAAREVANAMARIAEGRGSFDKAAFELRIAAAARGLEAWGQDKVSRALRQLERLHVPQVSKAYSRY